VTRTFAARTIAPKQVAAKPSATASAVRNSRIDEGFRGTMVQSPLNQGGQIDHGAADRHDWIEFGLLDNPVAAARNLP
jgi:hypothetical protein